MKLSFRTFHGRYVYMLKFEFDLVAYPLVFDKLYIKDLLLDKDVVLDQMLAVHLLFDYRKRIYAHLTNDIELALIYFPLMLKLIMRL